MAASGIFALGEIYVTRQRVRVEITKWTMKMRTRVVIAGSGEARVALSVCHGNLEQFRLLIALLL